MSSRDPKANGDGAAGHRPTRIGGPLDQANDTFHEAYGATRDERTEEGPILVLLGDDLTVVRGDARERHGVTPREVHALKSLAHLPPAVFALLHQQAAGALSAAMKARVAGLRDLVGRVSASLADDVPDEAIRRELHPLVDETSALLALVERRGELEPTMLDAYAARCGPLLLRCTDHATRAQLRALDAVAAPLLRGLSPRDKQRLQVVVGGDHQARSRSFGMQYFVARCGEEPGRQRHVTFGENVTSIDEAIRLVGTRRADRLLAKAFFGDAERLQRDVLGDAAKAILEEAKLEPLL